MSHTFTLALSNVFALFNSSNRVNGISGLLGCVLFVSNLIGIGTVIGTVIGVHIKVFKLFHGIVILSFGFFLLFTDCSVLLILILLLAFLVDRVGVYVILFVFRMTVGFWMAVLVGSMQRGLVAVEHIVVLLYLLIPTFGVVLSRSNLRFRPQVRVLCFRIRFNTPVVLVLIDVRLVLILSAERVIEFVSGVGFLDQFG